MSKPERTTYLMKQWRDRALAAELKVEQLEGDVIEEEERANENATLVHEARAERDAAKTAIDRVLILAKRWEKAAGTDRDNESRCLREVATYLRAAIGEERDHRDDCPALHSPGNVDRCRCAFLVALDNLEGK